MTVERIEPGPGQESVWDYPRPPRVEDVADRVTVVVRGPDGLEHVLADSVRAKRVLETSQAPAYYLPPEDVELRLLRPADTTTYCEWKGVASYVDLVVPAAGGPPRVVPDVGWRYERPTVGFGAIAGYLAFYAQKAERATVGADVVSPNDGDFYGGWITPRVVGPFKGGAGTRGW
ncbi:MAG: DUF427 domain-containing protein [Microthrixaceae bacterium]